MLGWLRKKTELPLSGAPAVRREKNYVAQSGYVYHYFYTGHRSVPRGGEPGMEYVFDVATDTHARFPVSVVVSDSTIAPLRLSPTERYAVAKIALLQAFDERASPPQMKEEVRVRSADLPAILETLGLD